MPVVVVESPAKAKTINKYLGSDYTVLASYGHVRDLPPKDGSVDPEHEFDMKWEVASDSKKHVKAIADALKGNEVLTECNLLDNNLDFESATALAKIGTEKGIMLSGIKHDQTEADFSGQSLKPADGILIASDLRVSAAMTNLSLRRNNIGPSGASAIAEALKVNAVLTSLE